MLLKIPSNSSHCFVIWILCTHPGLQVSVGSSVSPATILDLCSAIVNPSSFWILLHKLSFFCYFSLRKFDHAMWMWNLTPWTRKWTRSLCIGSADFLTTGPLGKFFHETSEFIHFHHLAPSYWYSAVNIFLIRGTFLNPPFHLQSDLSVFKHQFEGKSQLHIWAQGPRCSPKYIETDPFYFSSLQFTDIVLYRLKVCGKAALSKSVGIIFPISIGSLCVYV